MYLYNKKKVIPLLKEGKEPGQLGPLIGPLIGLTALFGLMPHRNRWPWYHFFEAFQILTSVYDLSDSVWS